MSSSPVGSSRATIRRVNKPLLEKKRRARINASLNQLKMLVLETFQKDSARYSKLEKADILEMTVVHLKTLRHQQKTTAHPHRLVNQYGAGYKECANEIRRYLDTVGCSDAAMVTRLEHHLTKCVRKVDQAAVDIGLNFGPEEALLSSQTSQYPLLPPVDILYPIEMERLDRKSLDHVVFAENETARLRRCSEKRDLSDEYLSSLITYLGVTAHTSVACISSRFPPHERQKKLHQTPVLDENDNISGKDDVQISRDSGHVVSVGVEGLDGASAGTVRNLLLRSFDLARSRPASAGTMGGEAVWRPW